MKFDTVVPFETGRAVVLRSGSADAPVLWGIGGEVATALKTAELLAEKGIECTVINARFLKPFDRETALKYSSSIHITIEDHSLSGGLYSALSGTLGSIAHGEIHGIGWQENEVIAHGDVALLKKASGLTAEAITEKICRLIKKK